ncbi:class II aldolase/adducin family protein [Pollutimonas harenae]|uniref:Class II aldolase/adducin family protein n=1 Tax=Pollutimonas harenae TaxID=657015 RepID=A0A853GSM2_9BURK|nr:class II aldolase/adducin family protein [Pollutimonas harenae]NYT85157.1 class II aldolase/adducin family protein [Pollutimonas harenae]TEA72463.1 class II aldolase/adducin family protein [Pollutimonas harenae]
MSVEHTRLSPVAEEAASNNGFELASRSKPDVVGITPEEKAVRVDLAAAYRLCALHGWDDLIYTHISAKVPGPEHHFLVNPLGLGFDEITASSLVKIDLDGNIIGESKYRPNAAGFVIHGGIHQVREDAVSIMHLHTEHGMALSILEEGLLPLTQHAMRFYERIGYHDYEGIALSNDERKRLINALGSHNALVLRNHGTLTVGKSVGAAFVEMFYLEKAARAQLLATAGNRPIRIPDQKICALTAQQWQDDFSSTHNREWPALLRKLTRLAPGYDV